jgi:tetratricopeptide (TPR) repeat protein
MAQAPHAVVIPFGVPSEGRGLGLGLAALLHGFVQIDGRSVALAQLHKREPSAEGDDAKPAQAVPVEAFVPPSAWRDLAGAGNAPAEVRVVVTGSLEPPSGGRGHIQLLAFDPKDGATRAEVELPFEGAHAGQALFDAFSQVCSSVGGELGMLSDIRDLEWDALESVLRAERCALHDPQRGGPHDRLAAMAHLGRAIGDAPDARFPAGRLATIALDAAMAGGAAQRDPRLGQAALRALVRAADDAPAHVDLVEAMAALHVRLGDAREAERRLNAAIARAPDRPRLYALLSEALRSRGDSDAALSALQAGLEHVPGDALLETEQGIVRAQRGEHALAAESWERVLAREPAHGAAFANLAALATSTKDAAVAQRLVDGALAAPAAPPDVLRRAVQLALATEPEGLARASRLAKLGKALAAAAPEDPWAALIHARALSQLGESQAALSELSRVTALAPGSAVESEAQRLRFAIEDPAGALELESAFRAACAAEVPALDDIAARARRLALTHGVWTAWVAAAIAERRRLRWHAAREAAEAAIRTSPGAAAAHAELSAALIALSETKAALAHAEKVLSLEGEAPRTLGLHARALFASGRLEDAEQTVARALSLDPHDEANRRLSEQIRAAGRKSEPGLFARALRALRRGKDA